LISIHFKAAGRKEKEKEKEKEKKRGLIINTDDSFQSPHIKIITKASKTSELPKILPRIGWNRR
jgi:hypothetical protein